MILLIYKSDWLTIIKSFKSLGFTGLLGIMICNHTVGGSIWLPDCGTELMAERELAAPGISDPKPGNTAINQSINQSIDQVQWGKLERI